MHTFLGAAKSLVTRKKALLTTLATIIALSGTATAAYHGKKNNQRKNTPVAPVVAVQASATQTHPAVPQTDTAPVAEAPKPVTTPVKTPTKAPVATPAPVTTPVNTTNCLPANPSVYATYHTGITNSAYLQTNSYGETNKMYAALQFAGLLSAVDAKQVVVFAPNDYTFDNKLSAAQQTWMNQSPDNMKSVIGWQVVTGCVTYDGINPTKDITGSITLTTLNGPVNFSAGGIGKVENASIAIWDWFTSNGAVTFITDFVKPPASL